MAAADDPAVKLEVGIQKTFAEKRKARTNKIKFLDSLFGRLLYTSSLTSKLTQ